jgi:hypothetical protein
MLIFSRRCETPAGAAGQERPRTRKALRMLTARPAESEHPGAENQQPNLTEPKKKFTNPLLGKYFSKTLRF